MALRVVRVCETIRGLFAVRLTQQGVEAVEAVEANVSGVAGAVETRRDEVLLWQKLLLLLVVVTRLVEVVLIQGGQHGLVCIQGTPAIQAACAAVSGHLQNGANTVSRASTPHAQCSPSRLQSSPCTHPAVS